MRLIDADELVKDLSFLYDNNGFVKNEESRKILTTIGEQPTAYDIDKVVNRLNGIKVKARKADDVYGSAISYTTQMRVTDINEAITIVKNDNK